MGSVGVGRSDLLVWTEVRRHTWFLWLRWWPWGHEWAHVSPPPGRSCANNAAGQRDLANGGRLNGSEQTAGAGEQTQQPHQKAKRPWTDEVRRPGQIPKTRNAAERPRNTDKWMIWTKKDSRYTRMRMMRMRHCFIHWHLNTHQSDLKWKKRWISPV